jgi:hypothetical protein
MPRQTVAKSAMSKRPPAKISRDGGSETRRNQMAEAPHSPESNTASPAAVVPVHRNAREAIIFSKPEGRFGSINFAGQVGSTTLVAAVKGSSPRISFHDPYRPIRGAPTRHGFPRAPIRARERE